VGALVLLFTGAAFDVQEVALPDLLEPREQGRVGLDPELLHVQRLVPAEADVVRGPTDRLDRAVLIIERVPAMKTSPSSRRRARK
jgi:hypothetical protein